MKLYPRLSLSSLCIASILFLLFCNTCLANTKPQSAKFIETQPGVYQSSNLDSRVIVSYEIPGIFIVFTNKIDLQLFDPENLDLSNSQHVFISYDISKTSYAELTTGKKKHNIIGSFTLKLTDKITIAIDNTNPYLTITDSANQIILGFRGLENIVNESGPLSLTFLEANQFNDYSDIILPYNLKAGELYIKDELVRLSSIGLAIQAKQHACLNYKGSIFVTENTLKTLPKALGPADLKEYLKRKAELNADNMIVLRSDAEKLISFDISTGKVFKITSKETSVMRGELLCLVEEVKI